VIRYTKRLDTFSTSNAFHCTLLDLCTGIHLYCIPSKKSTVIEGERNTHLVGQVTYILEDATYDMKSPNRLSSRPL